MVSTCFNYHQEALVSTSQSMLLANANTHTPATTLPSHVTVSNLWGAQQLQDDTQLGQFNLAPAPLCLSHFFRTTICPNKNAIAIATAQGLATGACGKVRGFLATGRHYSPAMVGTPGRRRCWGRHGPPMTSFFSWGFVRHVVVVGQSDSTVYLRTCTNHEDESVWL